MTIKFIRHPHYIVLCSNIGTVYDGYDELQARRDYMNYAEASKMGIGRAGNEPVSLMCDGEPIEEHTPVHYHALNGYSGCMPDSNSVCTSKADAVSSLCTLFEDSISAEELEELRTNLQSSGLHYFSDAEKGTANNENQ